MAVLEEIRLSIEHGRPKDTEKLVRRALEEKVPPEDILEHGMIPAMRNVGEAYKNYTADIPRILSAARGMRKGMDVLEPFLGPEENRYIGTVILGTVAGDLHDVGKNLVAIMFRSAGFKVIDLGVDISDRQFLKALKENPETSIVCISSLLTTSMPEMRQIVKSLHKSDKEHRLKIMVGGGSVTQEFADEIGADGYTENAVDAAELAKTFLI
ncbi:MAG TPA: methionine synthase [Lachnospiraceae bacterium]|nr:methionine synthase [Lachnospiraceae bacterium]